MTDMSYNIKCTFAEIFIFIRAIVQKYNLVHIVRVLVDGQYGHGAKLAFSASCSGFQLLAFSQHCCPYGVNDYGFCGTG